MEKVEPNAAWRVCSTCEKQRTGSVLSLDKFSADGFDVPDSLDIDELVEDKLLLEELFAALDLTPRIVA